MLELLEETSEYSKIPKEYRRNPQFYTLETLNSIYTIRRQAIIDKISRVMGKAVQSITKEVIIQFKNAYNVKIKSDSSRSILYINNAFHTCVEGDNYRREFAEHCLYEIASDIILADPNFTPKPIRRFIYIDNRRLCTAREFEEAKEGYPFLISAMFVFIKLSDNSIEELNCSTKESITYSVEYCKK